MSPALLLLLVATPLRVGVTLHPYYSWTAEVTRGLEVEVVPVVPGDLDIGSYQPRPQEVALLGTLDALVVNGLGHDAFIDEMVRASGNRRLLRIRVNDGTPLLVTQGHLEFNSHTFLSLGNGVIQCHVIARALASLKPEWRDTLERNAAAYAKRLRRLRAQAVSALAFAKERRVITVHDGYSYLLQELGLSLAGVVEPAHGVLPTARELSDIVALVRAQDVRVVLSEESFPEAFVAELRSAGAKVVVVSHIATGVFSNERFEAEMTANLATIVRALTE
jgi:zinc transport system substrate-binding protein